jgi:hypothetical protein
MHCLIVFKFFLKYLTNTEYMISSWPIASVRSSHTVFMCFVFIREKKGDLCHLQHKMIGFYNRDKKYLLRGTDWVFK